MNAYVRCLHDIIEPNYNNNFNRRPRLSITRTDETPIGETQEGVDRPAVRRIDRQCLASIDDSIRVSIDSPLVRFKRKVDNSSLKEFAKSAVACFQQIPKLKEDRSKDNIHCHHVQVSYSYTSIKNNLLR